MLPPPSLSAVLIVLALVPGWLYLRFVERLQPPSKSSGLHQLLEVLAVGLTTTGAGAVIVLMTPHRILPFTVDIDAWALQGGDYPRMHVRAIVATVAVILVVAVLISLGLYWLRARRKPAEFRSQGNVWVHSLGARPPGKVPYVGLHLDDGRLVEGQLHSYALDENDGRRDIAIQRPIRITSANETVAKTLPNLDRLIVPAARVAYITVIHAPTQTAWPPARGGARGLPGQRNR